MEATAATPRFLKLFLCCLLAAALSASAFQGSGPVVATRKDGTQLQERLTIEGRQFRWKGTVDLSSRTVAEAEQDGDITPGDNGADLRPLRIAEFYLSLLHKSDEELAMLFRDVKLIGREEYVEEIPEDQRAARGQQARESVLQELDTMAKEREGDEVAEAAKQPPRISMNGGPVAIAGGASAIDNEKMGASGSNMNATMQHQGQGQDPDHHHHHHGGKARRLLGGSGNDEEDEEEEAAAAAAAAAAEYNSVCMEDSRILKQNLWWPHTSHLALGTAQYSTSNAMSWHSCSATLVSASTALSAAHCFWDLGQGVMHAPYHWAPGYDSEDYDPSPYGMWEECYVVTFKEIYKSQTPGSLGSRLYDFAVLTFDECTGPVRDGVNPSVPGSGLALCGYWPNVPSSMLGTLYNRGYPGILQECGTSGTACNTRIWGDTGTYSGYDSDFVYYKDVKVSGGHSGSGTYVYWEGDGYPYAACVHIASSKCSGQTYSYEGHCKKITGIFDQMIQSASVDF